MRRSLLAACAILIAASGIPAGASATETLAQAVASPDRTPKLVARDPARHPVAELSFFGIKPDSSVVEIWPGGGYWTEILAPYLHDHGTYTLALGGPDEGHFATLPPALAAKFKAEPQVFGRVKFSTLGKGHDDIAPPGSADFVLTFRNLHNWMDEDDTPEMLAAIRTALKPGGILGIEDHRARPDQPQDPKAADGYVRQDYATTLIEHAGFKLVGSSEIDANPRDTTHWPKGVWTLPPVLAMGQTDRAKYRAIGEADNFVLKFRKTAD